MMQEEYGPCSAFIQRTYSHQPERMCGRIGTRNASTPYVYSCWRHKDNKPPLYSCELGSCDSDVKVLYPGEYGDRKNLTNQDMYRVCLFVYKDDGSGRQGYDRMRPGKVAHDDQLYPGKLRIVHDLARMGRTYDQIVEELTRYQFDVSVWKIVRTLHLCYQCRELMYRYIERANQKTFRFLEREKVGLERGLESAREVDKWLVENQKFLKKKMLKWS